MTGLSTHVLDTARGLPAEGVVVSVFREGERVGAGVTGADGRIADLLAGGALTPGWYRLEFDVEGYYGSARHFFGRVTLEVAIAEDRHHHVPLLLSPFSIGSYRGS